MVAYDGIAHVMRSWFYTDRIIVCFGVHYEIECVLHKLNIDIDIDNTESGYISTSSSSLNICVLPKDDIEATSSSHAHLQLSKIDLSLISCCSARRVYGLSEGERACGQSCISKQRSDGQCQSSKRIYADSRGRMNICS